MLTSAGRIRAYQQMAGITASLARGIAVGIGETTPALTDDFLELEVYRVPVNLVAPDYENSKVVFKALLPADITGRFYEVGLVANDQVAPEESRTLTEFTEEWSVGIQQAFSTTTRWGGVSLAVSDSTSGVTKLEGLLIDLSQYVEDTQFKLGVYAQGPGQITLTFGSGLDFSYNSQPVVAGYNILTFPKSAFTGSVDWVAIDGIELTVTGGMSVWFDILRVEGIDPLLNGSELVARHKLSTPLIKESGIPVEVEYAIGVSIA